MVEMQSGYSGPRRSWTRRMVAASRLDTSLYEEVEADTGATWQAAAVVAVAAIAHAIGASDTGTGGIIGALLGSLIGWAVWAAITYFIGTRLFHGTADWGELARTLGFAQSPGVLYVFGLLPWVGGIVEWIIGVWILVAGIIAIRQALDIKTGKAVIVAIVGWLALIVLTFAFSALFWAVSR